MKVFASALALALGLAATASAAPANNGNGVTHTAFVGGLGFLNPCNNEFVTGTGPVKIDYQENNGHYVMHSTFRVKGTGSLGNEYVITFETNGQFDQPSGSGPGYIYFDTPITGNFISKGGDLNVKWTLYARTFVSDGVATGGMFIGPSTAECQGQ